MRSAFRSWLFFVVIYSLFLSSGVFRVSGQCLGDQQSFLMELKSNLVFDAARSKKLVMWNPTVDCCSWEGIACKDGNVIGLDLAEEFISGGLDNSSSLFGLQHLQSLNFAYNSFNYSPLPSKFDRLTNLNYLNLSYSYFAGQVPLAISQLTRLVILDLSDYAYSKVTPLKLENPNLNMLIQNLSQLVELHLDGVVISENDNKWCQALSSSLPNLRVLSLSNCSLFGPIDSSLLNLQLLSIIDLSENNLFGRIPNFVVDFKNLTFLDLSFNQFSGLLNEFSNVSTYSLMEINLGGNNLEGPIPKSIFELQGLETLDLSSNQFSGQLNEFSNVTTYSLKNIYLDNNNLEGPIPKSIFELQGLEALFLYSNNFSGSFQFSRIRSRNLSFLDLSGNYLLTIEYNGYNSSSFLQMKGLSLASTKIKEIPDFLRNSNLESLDLSDNQIAGKIPNWIWNLSNLRILNLSYNHLITLERPFLSPSLEVLSLCFNKLQGELPFFPSLEYLDLSRNSFQVSIPNNIDQYIVSLKFLSLSSNRFHGSIPKSICNASNLLVLDLSNNSFSTNIPQCLIQLSGNLKVLNLAKNNLTGTISNSFLNNCSLQTLALNENQIEGELPKSLANCVELEYFDIGNNNIRDTFPFYLEDASMLRILILQSNKFYGLIPHLSHNGNWPMLQILDISSNNFIGRFPKIPLSTWKVMMDNKDKDPSKLHHHATHDDAFSCTYLVTIVFNDLVMKITFSYQETVTTTFKGLRRQLVKIHSTFTAVDFSCNNFDGPIPEEVGELKMLYTLNLSHNAFIGHIPSSLGKLVNLESLDLSSNKLFGEIPIELADGLIFLSALNFSFNQLVGPIPMIKQFATFLETSFEGNEGLFGFPLKSKCIGKEQSTPSYNDTHFNSKTNIEWTYISIELGFLFGFGIIIGPLMFWKKWRIWYYKHVDDIFFKIFRHLHFGKDSVEAEAAKIKKLIN